MNKMDKELESLELRIAKFLRFGVILAGILIFGGWVVTLNLYKDPFYSFQIYDTFPLQNILSIYYRNGNWGILISYLGLAVLISLPLIRVLLTACLFLKQKDYLLGTIAFVVLMALLVSFFLGIEL